MAAAVIRGRFALAKSGYQPFGENPAVLTGTYRYTARRFDPETAGSAAQPSGLYYYRARTYSPTWGRFLQPDPVGYAGGNNLYAYVNNDPLNATDPSGLCVPYCITVPVGAVLGVAGAYLADPAHFGLRAALAGATLGALAGAGVPYAIGLVGESTTVGAVVARIAITGSGGFVAGGGGSVVGAYVTGQPIEASKSLAIGGAAAGVALLGGEAAVAGLATGLSPTASASLSAYMSAVTATLAAPLAYVINGSSSPAQNAPGGAPMTGPSAGVPLPELGNSQIGVGGQPFGSAQSGTPSK